MKKKISIILILLIISIVFFMTYCDAECNKDNEYIINHGINKRWKNKL